MARRNTKPFFLGEEKGRDATDMTTDREREHAGLREKVAAASACSKSQRGQQI